MGRYWIFGGSNCYPSGGAYDMRNSTFKNKDNAIKYAKSGLGKPVGKTPVRDAGGYIEWVHVFDSQTQSIVFQHPENEEL